MTLIPLFLLVLLLSGSDPTEAASKRQHRSITTNAPDFDNRRTDIFVPSSVIHTPEIHCGKGQRRDAFGKCRSIIE